MIIWIICGILAGLAFFLLNKHLHETKWKILTKQEVFGFIFYPILILCIISGPIGFLWVFCFYVGSMMG